MSLTSQSWLVWALLSAVFAALTAIFAKVGIGGIDSDPATFIRTIVIDNLTVPGYLLRNPHYTYPMLSPAR